MRNALLRNLFPDPPKPKPPSQVELRYGDAMCEECERDAATVCVHPTLHPYAMYVTPDDPLRDTVEKAERYYKTIEKLMARKALLALLAKAEKAEAPYGVSGLRAADEADTEAALKLLGVPASARDMLDVVDA